MARTVYALWEGQLRRTKGGLVIPDVRNVLIALRGDPDYATIFKFDEMRQEVWLDRQPPLVFGDQPSPPFPRFLTPEDHTYCQEWLQEEGLPRVGHDVVVNAIDVIARERRFHPIRNWLSRLEWDGEPRIGSWLHRFVGTPDDEYHRQIGAMFLIAMVARVFEPGCQADYMLVLEGPQGEEKSKLCRAIAGDDYFSDHLPDLTEDPVRLSMHLRGKWLVEIPELSAINRADSSQLKSFVTRRVEIFTPKYAKVERKEPRQCNFIGTTNDDTYLKDETGGRRFWPVKVRIIDVPGFLAVRDQLFAEALQAYREGKHHWPDKAFEREIIIPEQGLRQFVDAWTDRVLDICAASLVTSISIAEIWRELGGQTHNLDMAAQKRIANILRTAGFTRTRIGENGRFAWKKPSP
jgi:predicted P-loop ATPase